MSHVAPLAAAGDARPRRSLLLAGGGMRVAWQAGALVALENAGLRFHHADGTSGGTFNLAMLLSGVAPREACERWRHLDPRAFVAPPPLRWVLRGPPMPALAGATGLRDRVFPALGVDPARMRTATGLEGTFNVCDFADKRCVAVPHGEADLDVLVAGVSLPLVSPAVRRDGRTLVDAVWVKDTNVGEAVRRGAEELWLLWCIGNHGVYRDGAFQQVVHMIEMSAGGALGEELARLPAGVRLHVVRPLVPLPLDPDFLLGRVDAATLVAMGHRDAVAYLAQRREEGVAPDARATRSADPRPGVAWRERLTGAGLEAALGWEVDDLDAFADAPGGTLVGDVTHPALGRRVLADGGTFVVEGGRAVARLSVDGCELRVERSLRRWPAARATLRDTAGATLFDGPVGGASPARTLHARGVGSPQAGARAVARFWGLAARAARRRPRARS